MFVFGLLGVFSHAHQVLAVAPTGFTSQNFTDTNNDQIVETMTVVINGGEALNACAVGAGELATDWTYTGGNAITGSILSATCDLPSGTITFVITGTSAVTGAYTGHLTMPTIAYDNDDGDNSISNASGALGTVGAATLVDLAKPIISGIQLHDDNGDGFIDRVDLLWSENIDTNDGAPPVFADLPTIILPDGSIAAATTISDPAGASYIVSVSGITGQVTVDTSAGSAAVTGNVSEEWADIATVPNAPDMVEATAHETVTDFVPPVVASVSPASAATGVSTSTSVSLTFSEAMDAGFVYNTEFTSSPNPGGWGAPVWTNGGKTVTLSHTAFICNTSYTITTAEATIDASGGSPTTLITTGPVTGDWSFTTAVCRSGGSSINTPAKTYLIDLTTPLDTDILTAGQGLDLKWATSGTGSVTAIDLSYSTDNGSTWIVISDNTENDGLFMWTVPSLAVGTQVKVKAEATDTVVVLATDSSANLSIGTTSTAIPAPAVPTTPVTAPVTSGFGPSPVTGLQEAISGVSVGQYIRSTSLPTVYYLDPNGTRRPFLNEQVYFTWASSFNQIVTVTDATLPTIPMGTPVIPKPGTVLVKLASSPKVYAVEAGDATSTKAVLHWIPSESVALSVYGADWSDYVIDIPDTIISRYTYGADLTSSDIKSTNMKKRLSLRN